MILIALRLVCTKETRVFSYGCRTVDFDCGVRLIRARLPRCASGGVPMAVREGREQERRWRQKNQCGLFVDLELQVHVHFCWTIKAAFKSAMSIVHSSKRARDGTVTAVLDWSAYGQQASAKNSPQGERSRV